MGNYQYLYPLRVALRSDGLWTVLDAAGREVAGVAGKERANAENCVIALTAWRDKPPSGKPYIHLTPRED